MPRIITHVFLIKLLISDVPVDVAIEDFLIKLSIYCNPWRSSSFLKVYAQRGIDLFRLYILFSQYRSCDDTQERKFDPVLFIKHRHIHACMYSF